MFVAMLDAAAAGDSSVVDAERAASFPTHLRKGIAAGSSVPESLMRKIYDHLGLQDLVICYGMTETSPVSAMTAPQDTLDRRTRTVGCAMPHTQLKVVDPADRSKVLPVGERGELGVAGYGVMKGYWGDEERTREDRVEETNEDGSQTVWMYSGDEASMDEHGYVQITGRIKDLIIRGGENIHPLEIEDCLFKHPLVAEVSVVGVPDQRYGECVAAFVVPGRGVLAVEDEEKPRVSDGQDDSTRMLTKSQVREWVATHLSGHLVPRFVFWIGEYPKTASGKIQKYKLRDMAKDLVYGKPNAPES
jgi:acyl-CoA synthetase (AMP-forming)/AMP-acid ligase II